MHFPYERYETLAEPLTVLYPAREASRARWVSQVVDKALVKLVSLPGLTMPEMKILLVDMADWQAAPRDEDEETSAPHPYWTDVTSPPSLVVPSELDTIFGKQTPEKLAFMLYHELALAVLEYDQRPWPDEYPLWADEWQLKFVALWLSHSLDGQSGVVNKDLYEKYEEIFDPELDGKTPVTIRGFDWYDDTTPEDYLTYELLLEQFACDLLEKYDIGILPQFLDSYRKEYDILLSDDVTEMLGKALGPGGIEWLESLVYF